MEENMERVLLEQLTNLTRALVSRPREALAPFGEDFIDLSLRLRMVAAELQAHTKDNSGTLLRNRDSTQHSRRRVSASSLDSSLAGDMESCDVLSTSTAGLRRDSGTFERKSPKTYVQQFVMSAFTQFASQRRALMGVIKEPAATMPGDERLLHLQPIFFLERKRRKYRIDLKERLLLICSCMSLAQDFHEFEVRNGWVSKQDALVSAILREEEPSVQQLGKHFQTYVASVDIQSEDHKRLDVGVRLGTKLNILESIGTFSGLGECLPFILGFEITKLLRLPYDSFNQFWPALSFICSRSDVRQSTQAFSAGWTAYRAVYEQRYGHRNERHFSQPPAEPLGCTIDGQEIEGAAAAVLEQTVDLENSLDRPDDSSSSRSDLDDFVASLNTNYSDAFEWNSFWMNGSPRLWTPPPSSNVRLDAGI